MVALYVSGFPPGSPRECARCFGNLDRTPLEWGLEDPFLFIRIDTVQLRADWRLKLENHQ